jgi:hypothetical protein
MSAMREELHHLVDELPEAEVRPVDSGQCPRGRRPSPCPADRLVKEPASGICVTEPRMPTLYLTVPGMDIGGPHRAVSSTRDRSAAMHDFLRGTCLPPAPTSQSGSAFAGTADLLRLRRHPPPQEASLDCGCLSHWPLGAAAGFRLLTCADYQVIFGFASYKESGPGGRQPLVFGRAASSECNGHRYN